MSNLLRLFIPVALLTLTYTQWAYDRQFGCDLSDPNRMVLPSHGGTGARGSTR